VWNLFIEKNETVVLAGESGSGKTISALSVTGILPENARIYSGEVLLNGENILGLEESGVSY